MGVYIKGLNKKDISDLRVHKYGGAYEFVEHEDIIEVKTPHGRLIDANEALHHFTLNMNWSDEDGYPIHDWEERESILKDFVDGVSTVIKAEVE